MTPDQLLILLGCSILGVNLYLMWRWFRSLHRARPHAPQTAPESSRFRIRGLVEGPFQPSNRDQS